MALKVLLADDSVPAQNMGKKILTDAGYEVLAVSNGLEALKKIADHVPDIAILDIFMPGYTGLEVCSRLRGNAVTAELPVILTVGKLEPYRPEDGQKVHSNAVIVKPFASAELIAAVRSLVGLPFAMRKEVPEAKAPATPAPASTPAAEDDYEEEAPMLAGFGFDGVSSAPAPSGLGWDPDAKRSAFSASAVEDAPGTTPGPAFHVPPIEAAPANGRAVAAPSLSDFTIEPEPFAPQESTDGNGQATPAATSTSATATALVEWWQPGSESVQENTATEAGIATGMDSRSIEVEPDAGVLGETGAPSAQSMPALESSGTLGDSKLEITEDAHKRGAAAEATAILSDASTPPAALVRPSTPNTGAPGTPLEASAQPPAAIDGAVPDRESRMQAFEALFNSDEAIPLEPNPAALDDLLAQEALEAQGNETEPVPPIALGDGPEGLPHSATASDVARELNLDAESLENWLSTGSIPNEPQSPACTLEHSPAPAQSVAACDSFFAGIPENSEAPQCEAVKAAPAMLRELPQEPPTEAAPESSIYASGEPAGTTATHGELLAQRDIGHSDIRQFDAAQAHVKQDNAAQIEALACEAFGSDVEMHSEPAPGEAEIACGALEQEISQLVQTKVASEQAADASAVRCDIVPAAANEVFSEAAVEPKRDHPAGDAKRIHQAVESVFDRFRPLLIAAIARELTKRD